MQYLISRVWLAILSISVSLFAFGSSTCTYVLVTDESCKQKKDALSNQVICINTLDIDRKYAVVTTERITTKYGPTVLLSIKDKPFNMVKVFMLRRYSTAFTNNDIEEINTQKVKIHLVYKGLFS